MNGEQLIFREHACVILNIYSERKTTMKSFVFRAAVIATVAAFGAACIPSAGSAATRHQSAYDVKNAECKERAKHKNFGVHFVQRHRWIKNCIVGAA